MEKQTILAFFVQKVQQRFLGPQQVAKDNAFLVHKLCTNSLPLLLLFYQKKLLVFVVCTLKKRKLGKEKGKNSNKSSDWWFASTYVEFLLVLIARVNNEGHGEAEEKDRTKDVRHLETDSHE